MMSASHPPPLLRNAVAPLWIAVTIVVAISLALILAIEGSAPILDSAVTIDSVTGRLSGAPVVAP